MTLLEWLQKYKVSEYFEALRSNGIDLDVLSQLTEGDLKELGFTLGARKRMLNGIAALRLEEASPEQTKSEIGAREDEVRQITLMFVDLVGSSKLSAEMSLEQYRETLQSYQNCCLDSIRKHFGYVAQFLGDGVVAYFGYPVAEENDAERAVLAGLEIVQNVHRTVPKTGVALEARVGIASGDVLIGDIIGDGNRSEHFALGDVPNLAARIQSAVGPSEVGVSGRTHRLLGSNVDCVFAGAQLLKGFSEPVDIWVVREVRPTELRFQARSRGALSPLLGREEECHLLVSRWQDACRGDGQVVLVSGEAGIGKSRLVEALREEALSRPSVLLGFQCSPYHQDSTFYPLIVHLSNAVGLAGGDAQAGRLEKVRAFAARIAPDDPNMVGAFASLLSIDTPDVAEQLSPDEMKGRIFSALLTYFSRLAADRPEILLFEDLHWIDPSSEELLDLLIERIETDAILLLCTFRPEYRARWTGQARVTAVSLSRLDHQHASMLVRHLLEELPIPETLAETIIARAEGVPLFLEEMARMVLDRRRSSPNGAESVAQLELPSTLKDLLRAKIDHLPTARDVVPICAALGRSFSPDQVSVVYGRDLETTEILLGQLVHAQVLTPRGGGRDRSYAFRHALIQEAAHEAMLPSRSRALHRRIAEVYLSSFQDIAQRSPELVAQHYWRAGMAAEARDQWHAAAERTLRRSAGQEAIALLEAAIRANDTIEEEREREREEIRLRKTYNVALDTRAFGSPEVLQNLARLGELLSRFGSDAADAFLALHTQFGARLMSGNSEDALALCPEMEEVARSADNPTMSALTQHNYGMGRFMLASFDRAIEHFDRALVLRDRTSAAEVLQFHAADIRIVDACMRCWALSLSGGDSDPLRAALGDATGAARAEEHDFSRCFALNILASACQRLGDTATVLDLVAAAFEISQQKKFAYWDAWSAILRGWAWARSGDPGRGIPELRNGLEAYLAIGATQIELYAKTLLADAYCAAGEIERGLAEIDSIRLKQGSIAVRYHGSVTDQVERDLVRAGPGGR